MEGGRSQLDSTGVYFLIDGGNTDLIGFDNLPPTLIANDYDASNPADPFTAFVFPGQRQNYTSIDNDNMIALGNNPATTPEPGSLTLLACGFVGIIGHRVRRRTLAK
jgi:hypothetical protein